MCCVYDQSQGENQGVIVVTQRYLINYNQLTGSRRLQFGWKAQLRVQLI